MKKHSSLLILLSFLLTTSLTACSEKQSKTPQPTTKITPKAAEVVPVTTASRGEKLYKRCITCHTLEEGGKHKVGPNLHGIYGTKAGTKEGFAYSKVMEASGIIWTDETLDGYIENPAKFMPKNRMSFVGLRKPADRKELLDYLKLSTQ